MFKKITFSIYLTALLFCSNPLFATTPITIGGNNSNAVCQFMNKFVQPCKVVKEYNNDINSLNAVRNGKPDLAVIPYNKITKDDKAQVIMLTSKNQERAKYSR